MNYDTQQPRVASYLIVRKDSRVAFVKRSSTDWMNGYYGMPSGKVENDESFSEAAIREGFEEIGIKIKSQDIKCVHMMHRREGSDWVDAYFEVLNYEGEPYNAEPHMHSELAWMDLNSLPENIIPSVKYAIEQIQAGKYYSEYGWKS